MQSPKQTNQRLHPKAPLLTSSLPRPSAQNAEAKWCSAPPDPAPAPEAASGAAEVFRSAGERLAPNHRDTAMLGKHIAVYERAQSVAGWNCRPTCQEVIHLRTQHEVA